MTQAVSSQGDVLLVKFNGEWKQIHELKSVPELGDTPNRIDATSLESETREYIAGLSDQGDFEFTFNAMPMTATDSNVALMRSLSRNSTYPFMWKSPRLGIQMEWNAEFSYRYGAGEVDSVREFIVALIPHSKPVESPITSKYTLSYAVNGGSGTAPTSVSNIPNGTVKIVMEGTSMTPPSGKSGFAYWNTSADGMGTAYDVGDEIVMYGDVTLYAIWSE